MNFLYFSAGFMFGFLGYLLFSVWREDYRRKKIQTQWASRIKPCYKRTNVIEVTREDLFGRQKLNLPKED